MFSSVRLLASPASRLPIGGDAPKLYTFEQWPGASVLVSIEGYNGQYCDVDWYTTRPIGSNTGHLSLAYDDTFDPATLTAAQALERDTILTNGLTANFHFQIDLAAKWQLQISGANNQWVSTGYQIQPLAPNVVHHFLLTYAFNFTAKTYSYQSIAIDGITYQIPAALQNLAMQSRNWGKGAIFQFQQDATNTGGSYQEYLEQRNLHLVLDTQHSKENLPMKTRSLVTLLATPLLLLASALGISNPQNLTYPVNSYQKWTGYVINGNSATGSSSILVQLQGIQLPSQSNPYNPLGGAAGEAFVPILVDQDAVTPTAVTCGIQATARRKCPGNRFSAT